MIAAHVRRGLIAGLLAGLLAGLFALVVAEPQMDAAIAREEAAVAGHDGHVDHERETFARPVQKAGMVGGMALAGLAVGALFGVAAAWAAGRVSGHDWQRSLKLGAVVVGAVVLLPALGYPPNPPGVGDPEAMGARSVLYLGLAGFGLLLAVVAWAGARELAATDLPRPTRQLIVAAGVVVAVAAVLLVLPALGDTGDVPADLLWSFRLSSIGTQVVLLGGTAVAFGLLSVRVARRPQQVSAGMS